jgi:hypothetical protein
MQNRDISVGYVDILINSDIATKEGITRDGVVHVYRGGRRLIFYGHRSPEVLIAFLLKVSTWHYKIFWGIIFLPSLYATMNFGHRHSPLPFHG